jgi:hypothetical protein
MKTTLGNLLRARGASVRLAGGLGLMSLLALPVSSHAASPFLGDISLKISVDAPPPPPRPEVVIGVRPAPDYVWVGGYWDGSPGHYVWVSGHWDRPPHAHGVWVAPHWDRDHDGHYHMTRGEWREH